MNLSNIIVNYNHSDVLMDCVESIYKTINEIEFEIIVIDNSSKDEGIEIVKEKFPKIKLIRNKQNVGFGSANNQGFKISKGETILFLNPDIVLSKSAVNDMLIYFNSHENIGALGPKMLSMDGTLQFSCRSFPDIWTGLFNRYSLMSKIFKNNKFSTRYLLTDFDHNEIKEVDWLSGSCMMISRKDFKKVALFDENYFLFNEDVDLCKKLKNQGHKIVYYPYAKVYHHITSSNGKVDPAIIIKRHLGMNYYLKKHHQLNIVTMSLVNFFIALRCFFHLLFNLVKTHEGTSKN